MTTTANRNPATRPLKGITMTNVSHSDCTHALEGKAGKKARRACRDQMRAMFDYDAIRQEPTYIFPSAEFLIETLYDEADVA
jgi:hypothetical protein